MPGPASAGLCFSAAPHGARRATSAGNGGPASAPGCSARKTCAGCSGRFQSAPRCRRARDGLVGYYQRYHGERAALARPAHPYRFAQAVPAFGPLGAEEVFARPRRELDALGVRVPVLYRQYVELCEPGGVSFFAFGVDPGFAGSTDGLLRLDLPRLKPSRVARYLGRA